MNSMKMVSPTPHTCEICPERVLKYSSVEKGVAARARGKYIYFEMLHGELVGGSCQPEAVKFSLSHQPYAVLNCDARSE
jgi:hypothetical protein